MDGLWFSRFLDDSVLRPSGCRRTRRKEKTEFDSALFVLLVVFCACVFLIVSSRRGLYFIWPDVIILLS